MNTSRRAACCLLPLLLATGCMVGPSYQRPLSATPDAWGEIEPMPSPRDDGVPTETSRPYAGGVPVAWWHSFDDPLLTSLVARAVASNFDLAQAEARVRQARASRRIAAADLWPQLGASASYTRERTSGNTPGVVPGQDLNLFEAGFDASWEIDVFGGIRRGVEAATATLAAAEHERDAVLVSLMGEVGLQYVTYRSLQRRIDLAQQNLDAQQATLDLTRGLLAAGLSPELDVQRATALVATTASSIPAMAQQRDQAMHALATLIGQPPMALATELATPGPIPQPPAQVAVGLPSELLLRRPDVARSERRLAAATAEIGVATRDLFPRFSLLGTAGLQSVSASEFFSWPSRAAAIGPTVFWPVFEGGRIRANIALTTAEQEESLAAYQATVLQAFQDVEDALVAFSGAQATRAQLADAVAANQRATELARRIYAQGITVFLDSRGPACALHVGRLARAERADVALGLGGAVQVRGRWLGDGRRSRGAVSRAGGIHDGEQDRTDPRSAARRRPLSMSDGNDGAPRATAQRALDFVQDGQTLGLGTGRAAAAFVEALGERARAGLHVRGVPTSVATAELAKRVGVPLVDARGGGRARRRVRRRGRGGPEPRSREGLRRRTRARADRGRVGASLRGVGRSGEAGFGDRRARQDPGRDRSVCAAARAAPARCARLRARAAHDGRRCDLCHRQRQLDPRLRNPRAGGSGSARAHDARVPGVVGTGLFLGVAHVALVQEGDQVRVIERG